MTTSMKKEKFDRMMKACNSQGVIAAAAMDQRGSLKKAIAKEKGVDPSAVTDVMMTEFKTAVTEVLSSHASAMLLDPVWGLPASKKRDKNCGLLLAYEDSGYDNTKPGRLPDLLHTYSVERLKNDGADCCKILLYYTPFDPPSINDRKHAWVERIGAECEAVGLPFFLEFVGYPHMVVNQPHSGVEGGRSSDSANSTSLRRTPAKLGLDTALPGGGATLAPITDEKSLAFAKLKPEIVRKGMEEFSKPQYRVDVLKVEFPVNMKFVENTQSFMGKGTAYSRADAIKLLQATAKVTTKPFIYLSAGVSDAEYRESLELAIEAGVPFNGVLCGRATWKDGIPVYAKQGLLAFTTWLKDRGVKNIQALNAILEKGAKPWWNAYGGKEKIKVI